MTDAEHPLDALLDALEGAYEAMPENANAYATARSAIHSHVSAAVQEAVEKERKACATITDEWAKSDSDASEKLAARIIGSLIRDRSNHPQETE